MLLPHYSTNRIWIAAFQIPLSVLFYFVSLHADLRGLRAAGARFWAWRALGALALLASLLAYEITLFLFLLNPFIVARRARQLALPAHGLDGRRVKVATGFCVNFVLAAAALAFKAAVTQRLQVEDGAALYIGKQLYVLISPYHALSGYGLNIWSAIYVSYVQYGVGLPYVLWKVIADYADAGIVLLAGTVGAAIFLYLYPVARAAGGLLRERRSWLRVLLGGIVLFGAGYGTFLLTPQIALTPTGHGNRVSMAAAIGVALSLVGAFGWLAGRGRSDGARAALFAGLVAVFGAAGVLLNGTIASFWIAASERQAAVLGSIRQEFPTLLSGTVLILDGVCPYIGPGIVFDNFYDLGAALRILYRDPTLRADVVTERLTVTEAGLATSYYEATDLYPYGENLVFFDAARRTSHRLTDHAAALRHLGAPRAGPAPGCPEGDVAGGAPIF